LNWLVYADCWARRKLLTWFLWRNVVMAMSIT